MNAQINTEKVKPKKEILRFERTPFYSGNTYRFQIPKEFIDNGYIDTEREYVIFPMLKDGGDLLGHQFTKQFEVISKYLMKMGGKIVKKIIKFKKKPVVSGVGFAFLIPKKLIDFNIINKDKKYIVILGEIDEE